MKTFVPLFMLFFAVRINAQLAGTSDSTFSQDGKLATTLPDDNGTAKAVTVQPDGKILAGGYASNGNDNDFCVVRYHPDGMLDSSFNSTGILLTDFNAVDEIATSIAFRASDEKIILGGFALNGGEFDFAVAQYNTDGSPDNNFGTNGKVITSLGSIDFGNALAIQADGKILLGGYSVQATNEFAVVRYNTTGTLDSTFDGDGIVLTPVGTGSAIGFALLIQPDNKIVLAGQTANDSTFRWEAAVVRYNSNGSPDSSFNGSGIVISPFGNLDATINAIGLQSNGKIVIAGYAGTSPSNNNFLLLRYNANGSLDSTFGTNGFDTLAFSAQNNQATAMLVQPDDKLILGGSNLVNGADQFALARLDANGNLDNTFGTAGKSTTRIGGNDGIKGLAFDADLKIVAAGGGFHGTGFDFAVARYLNDLSTGISKTYADDFSLSVSPNPVARIATLSFTLKKNERVTIELVDMQGRVIESFIRNKKMEAGSYSKQLELPSTLPAGAYYMLLSTSLGKVGVKVVKY